MSEVPHVEQHEQVVDAGHKAVGHHLAVASLQSSRNKRDFNDYKTRFFIGRSEREYESF